MRATVGEGLERSRKARSQGSLQEVSGSKTVHLPVILLASDDGPKK
jgi:hypothetical protein